MESLPEGKEAIKIVTYSGVHNEEMIRNEAGPRRKLLLVIDDLMVSAKKHFSTMYLHLALIIGVFPWYL